MDQLINYDTQFFRAINNFSHPLLDGFMYIVSLLGQKAAIFALICILLLIFDRKKGKIAALFCVMTILISDQVIGHFFKEVWFRQRPYLALENVKTIGHKFTDSSFPSGHADAIVAGSLVIAYFYPRWKWPLYIFALLTCISRVYNGMHFPLDVCMGALIGIITSKTAIYIYEKYFDRSNKTVEAVPSSK